MSQYLTLGTGVALVGDPVKNSADSNAIGVLESIEVRDKTISNAVRGNFRKDSTGGLSTVALSSLAALSAMEIATRNEGIALAAAQAAFDAAAAALDTAGGDPCEGCGD